jgi:hypothetical protein
LAHRDRVAHVASQNDGQEVAPGVRDDVVEEVEPCEFPDLPVTQVEADAGPRELVGDGIASIALDARQDYAGFADREEWTLRDWGGLGALVGKVDDGDVSDNA